MYYCWIILNFTANFEFVHILFDKYNPYISEGFYVEMKCSIEIL